MSLKIVLAALSLGVIAPVLHAQEVIPGGGGPGARVTAGKYETEVKASMDSVLRVLTMSWNAHDANAISQLFQSDGSLRTRDDSAKGDRQVRAMLEHTLPYFRRVSFDLKGIDAPDDDAWLTATGQFEVRVDPLTVGTRPATVRLIMHRGFPRGWQIKLATIDLPTRDTVSLRQVDSVKLERREANELVPGDTIDSRTLLPDGVETFVEMRVHNGQHLAEHVVERRVWRDAVNGKPTMHVVLDYEGANPVSDTLLLDAATMVPRTYAAHHGDREEHIAFNTTGGVTGTRIRGRATENFSEGLGDPMFAVAELPLFAQMLPFTEGASRSMDAWSAWDGGDLARMSVGAAEPIAITPTMSVTAVPVEVHGPGLNMKLWLDPTTHALVMLRSEQAGTVTWWLRVMGGL